MPRFETDAILAKRYVQQDGPALTHVFDATTGKSLCRRVSDESRCGNPGLSAQRASCPTCAKRDPRVEPRALSTHLVW